MDQFVSDSNDRGVVTDLEGCTLRVVHTTSSNHDVTQPNHAVNYAFKCQQIFGEGDVYSELTESWSFDGRFGRLLMDFGILGETEYVLGQIRMRGQIADGACSWNAEDRVRGEWGGDCEFSVVCTPSNQTEEELEAECAIDPVGDGLSAEEVNVSGYNCGSQQCSEVPLEWGYGDPQYDTMCAAAVGYHCICTNRGRAATCEVLRSMEAFGETSSMCPACPAN